MTQVIKNEAEEIPSRVHITLGLYLDNAIVSGVRVVNQKCVVAH